MFSRFTKVVGLSKPLQRLFVVSPSVSSSRSRIFQNARLFSSVAADPGDQSGATASTRTDVTRKTTRKARFAAQQAEARSNRDAMEEILKRLAQEGNGDMLAHTEMFASQNPDLKFPINSTGDFVPRLQACAYRTASQYNLHSLKREIVDKFGATIAFDGSDALGITLEDESNIFFFQQGVVVMWAANPTIETEIFKFLESHSENKLKDIEDEPMYYYCGDLEVTGVSQGVLHLYDDPDDIKGRIQRMLACSYGLSRSVQLAELENQVDKVISETKNLPDVLLASWFSRVLNARRNEIRLRLHDVVKLRGSVNLHTQLLEAPDHYWDQPELEKAYECISTELDIAQRVQNVNKRLEYTTQLVELLRTLMQEGVSHRLEFIIIVLIAIEILLSLVYHRNDRGQEELLKQLVETLQQQQTEKSKK